VKAHKYKFIFISLCILAGMCLAIIVQDRVHQPGGIARNVWVGEIPLSGLKVEDAQRLLEQEYQARLSNKLTLTYKELSWELDPAKLGPKLNLATVIQAAYKVGREGNFWQRSLIRLQVQRDGLILEPQLILDEAKVRALGSQLAGDIDQTARNARLQVVEQDVRVVPSVTGRRLVVEKLPDLFFKAILEGNEKTISLPVEEFIPKLTTEKVASWGIKKQVAGFATRFNVANTNRVKNIELAAGKLDGHIVMAGEEFSFNKIVGTRGVREGYTEAPVIIDGKLVPGVGGGVCQVSSTLYNALLLADLKASKRNHHSMPVSYLPIGRDAAVAYDYLDLRFRNTSGTALLFKTSVEGDKLRVAIFGSGSDQVVDLESIVEEKVPAAVEKKLDSSLKPGEEKVIREGVSGYRVRVWRTVTQGGKLLRRELISTDYYRPVTKIVAVGLKEAEEVTQQASPEP
jgi:vancomycin resistance protein YoaR